MEKSRFNFILILILGVIIGFLVAFFFLQSKNAQVNEQNYPSYNKIAQLQNKTLVNQATNQTAAINCSSANNVYLSNTKLDEAINLLNEAINLSEVKKEYQNQSSNVKRNYMAGLLSPRIYAGILEPRSFLITNFDPLRNDIESYLEEQNVSASIYVENLRNGANFGINEYEGYFPASLNKLPIAILIMQNIEDGKLSLDSMIPIKDYERTDTFGTLYLTKEKELPIRILMEKMLKESDNTAFNVLFDNVDRSKLNKLLDYFNIKENVEYPFKRVEYGGYTDLVTSLNMYNIFSSLYLSTVLYAQDSEYILSLLTKTTEFDINDLAAVPYNVTIADKFGEYYVNDAKLFHDCGIIYISQSRIFYCIMMKNIELNDAERIMAHLVNHLYGYVVSTRSRLDIESKKGNSTSY